MDRQLSAPSNQGAPGHQPDGRPDAHSLHLSVSEPHTRPISGVVLVLHGGRVDSFEPTSAAQPAVLRLTWLARSIRGRLGSAGIVVARLRFGVRGWNGPVASPVAETRRAIDELRARYARYRVPVVLVGHSMGGRAAVRAAGQAGVTGVVALAPWLPPGEPVEQLAGRRLVIAHGTGDRITDPALSAAFADRARPVADHVHLEFIPGDGHAMLHQASAWHRLTAGHVREMLSRPAPGATR